MNAATEQALYSLKATADDESADGNHDRAKLLRACAAQLEHAVAEERERCANPLPAAEVQKIKDVCDSLGLDAVAFAWRVQNAASERA